MPISFYFWPRKCIFGFVMTSFQEQGNSNALFPVSYQILFGLLTKIIVPCSLTAALLRGGQRPEVRVITTEQVQIQIHAKLQVICLALTRRFASWPSAQCLLPLFHLFFSPALIKKYFTCTVTQFRRCFHTGGTVSQFAHLLEQLLSFSLVQTAGNWGTTVVPQMLFQGTFFFLI